MKEKDFALEWALRELDRGRELVLLDENKKKLSGFLSVEEWVKLYNRAAYLFIGSSLARYFLMLMNSQGKIDFNSQCDTKDKCQWFKKIEPDLDLWDDYMNDGATHYGWVEIEKIRPFYKNPLDCILK